MPNSKKPTNKLPSSRQRRCSSKMIAITALCLMIILSSCAEQKITTVKSKSIEPCRQSVVTYGDAVECMIKLDEMQYTDF